MNSANQMLQAIKNKKALLKKKLETNEDYTLKEYQRDISILNEEEKEWLSQFDDIPIEDIY